MMNIKETEVFFSYKIYPADWNECLKIARLNNYKYIDFNGTVYSTDIDELDWNDQICVRSDLE